MSKFVKAIQMRYRCASIIWLHDGVWLDMVVSSADIAIAEQEAVEEVLPNSTHCERLFRTRSLATDHSKAVELFSNIPTVSHLERNQQLSFMIAATKMSMMRYITHE